MLKFRKRSSEEGLKPVLSCTKSRSSLSKRHGKPDFFGLIRTKVADKMSLGPMFTDDVGNSNSEFVAFWNHSRCVSSTESHFRPIGFVKTGSAEPIMRLQWILAGVLALMQIGCTHLQLKRSTIRQASTLTELQYQLVLDNLAMFASNPEALPWHVKLKGGTIQVTDLGAGAFGGVFGSGDAANSVLPNLNAQRTRLGQWDVEPVVDTDELEMLQLAYQKAVRPYDEEIDQKIRFQIWTLLVAYQFETQSDVYMNIIQDAVTLWMKDVIRGLDLATNEVTVLDTQKIKEAKYNIEKAEAIIRELISLQLLENLPRPSGDSMAQRDEALLRFFQQLDLPGSNWQQFSHGFSPSEFNYLHDFNSKLTNLLAELQAATNNLESVTCRTKSVETWQKWVIYMNDEVQLRKTIQRINPWRAREIRRIEKNLKACDVCRSDTRADTTMRDNDFENVHGNALQFLDLFGSGKYFISQTYLKLALRNPGLSDQAQTKVDKLKELCAEDSPLLKPWFYVGKRGDVPSCACYVGHYRGCNADCYVWVMPDGIKSLSEFSLTIQAISAIEKQDAFSGKGASFSPGLR